MPTGPYAFQPRAYTADKVAFINSATTEVVSLGQLEVGANQGAHLLRALGMKPGDHIAILMENGREMLEVCFAADRTGIYYTTISTHLTEDEVGYILADCTAQVLIASDRYLTLLEGLTPHHSSDCTFLVVGQKTELFESWSIRTAQQP